MVDDDRLLRQAWARLVYVEIEIEVEVATQAQDIRDADGNDRNDMIGLWLASDSDCT